MKHTIAIIFVIAILVLAATVVWHYEDAPTVEHFYLHMHVNNATKLGNFTIDSYHYDIHYSWFNTTMAGYGNYTVLFPFTNIEYSSVNSSLSTTETINNTAHIYLAKNTTFEFNLTAKAPNGGIYIG